MSAIPSIRCFVSTRRLFAAAIVLFAVSIAPSADANDNETRARVEAFIGQTIESIVCEPSKHARSSETNPEDCKAFSQLLLESCWTGLAEAFPSLQNWIDEYESMSDSAQKFVESMKPLTANCLESGQFLSVDESTDYLDFRLRQKKTGPQPMQKVASWSAAIETSLSRYADRRDEILHVAESFRSSSYTGIYRAPGDLSLVYATTKKGDSHNTTRLDSPPAWFEKMGDLAFLDIYRYPSAISMSGGLNLETDDHDFMIQFIFEKVDDLPDCRARFESLSCGACVADSSKDYDTLVSWISKRLIQEMEAAVDATFDDPASAEDLDLGDRAARCIEDGIEEALKL